MTLTSLIYRTTRWLRGDECLAANEESSERPQPADRQYQRTCNDRYCLSLAADSEQLAGETERADAWNALEEHMALVPAGETSLVVNTIPEHDAMNESGPPMRRVRVRAVYLDRCAVTHAEYANFVAAGGYRRPEFWPSQLLPQVLQFLDRSGRPGPRYWSNGEPPPNKLDHPVVGISWYEANAYAQWVGKRLPTPAEWQRAGCWSDGEGAERKYPWGNSFDPKRANTWLAGHRDTVPVDEYLEGCTANGICQLVGNVWEWVAATFDCQSEEPKTHVLFEQPMGEIRGGAFDTYFESQATCQFRSGQPLLYRGPNVGFRCCVSVDQLGTPPDPTAILDTPRLS